MENKAPSVSTKSTGQLIDELVTNSFKHGYALSEGRDPKEFEERYEALEEALVERLGEDVAILVCSLALVSLSTWHAQEIVMHERDDHLVAAAGRQAQRLNARRSRIIREMDRLLGEAGITITTKTYG